MPLLLTSSTLGIWLADFGINRTTITLFALVGIPYALKFLWAPIVDQLRLGFFSRKLGQRKSWILFTELILILLIILLAFTDVKNNTYFIALIAFLIAFVSATHDIAIDAWRIEINNKEELGIGAALYVSGYRIALLVAGAGALIIADFFTWRIAYIFIASLFLITITFLIFIRTKRAVYFIKDRRIF